MSKRLIRVLPFEHPLYHLPPNFRKGPERTSGKLSPPESSIEAIGGSGAETHLVTTTILPGLP
jgi:hypothetical protein